MILIDYIVLWPDSYLYCFVGIAIVLFVSSHGEFIVPITIELFRFIAIVLLRFIAASLLRLITNLYCSVAEQLYYSVS